MRLKHISLFCISLLFISTALLAQEEVTAEADTIVNPAMYGLRVGFDMAKPLRTLLENGYTGFEVMADFRISKKLYFAVEIGNENKDRIESNLSSNSSGSYLKIGADINAYKNWFGLNNAIYFGLRYGISTFNQELVSYQIYNTNQTFPDTINSEQIDYNALTAHWVELIFGIKAEVLPNLFLSVNLQLKRKLAEDKPDNFNNLYIPGYNRTYDFSEFGVGYGYTISYLIPIFKK